MADHIQVYGIVFSSNLSEPIKSLRENVKDYLQGIGFLAKALASDGVLYYQTPLETVSNYPDIEISFGDGNSTSPALNNFQKWKPDILNAISKPDKSSSFSLFVSILRTYSRGTVRLRSSSPYDYPVINPNVLSDPEGRDMRRVYEGIQFALKLVNNTKAFKSINATFAMKPIKECGNYTFLTKGYWYCAMKYITSHNNHPVATCRMGSDPKRGYVVDSQLRVYGVRNLRVADASVIPTPPANHLNAMCIMIGEKAADIIKRAHKNIN